MRMLSSLAAIAAASVALPALGATIQITALDLRSTGVFGHPNATAGTIQTGPGDPTSFAITYANLDLDGDSSANDTVQFTVVWESPVNQRLFGQGADTGYGILNNLQVTVTAVSGTTTDSGDTIVFDGFTGAALGAGAGAGNAVDATANINGVGASVMIPDNGSFRFGEDAIDFVSPTSTVVFNDAVVDNGSSAVARHYDLQFSTVVTPIPQPAALAVLGIAGPGLVLRRRRA